MSLIVEDGTGLANAESYASVAEADTYHTARGNTGWEAVDDKEAALRKATDYMLQTYSMRWVGDRATNTQALDWPRTDATRKNVTTGQGWYQDTYSSTIVPTEVKRACAELALKAATASLSEDLGPEVSAESVSGAVSVTYAQGSRRTIKYSAVDGILMPALKDGGSSASVVRA